jgi:hypothetical protein
VSAVEMWRCGQDEVLSLWLYIVYSVQRAFLKQSPALGVTSDVAPCLHNLHTATSGGLDCL